MPDGTGGHGSADRSLIIRACENNWPLNSGDCSGFVKAVSSALHLHPPLSGQANDIYDQIHQTHYWDALGTGMAGATLAGLAGAEGKFVVAAWQNLQGNGHVAVVVDFSTQQDRALAYWGTLNAAGQRYSRITASFSLEKLQKTYFASRDIPHHLRRHRSRILGPIA
jgi:hypothetical protein